VIAADSSNRIVYASAAAAKLLGWARDDLLGKHVTTIVPSFSRFLETGAGRTAGQSIPVPVLRRDGSEVELGQASEFDWQPGSTFPAQWDGELRLYGTDVVGRTNVAKTPIHVYVLR